VLGNFNQPEKPSPSNLQSFAHRVEIRPSHGSVFCAPRIRAAPLVAPKEQTWYIDSEVSDLLFDVSERRSEVPISARSKVNRQIRNSPPEGPLVTGYPPFPTHSSPVTGAPRSIIKRGSHAGLPRRRPTDKTRYLTFEQVAHLVNATAFANHKGHRHRLTVAIALLWSHVAGFRDGRLGTMTTRLLDRINRWLRRHASIDLHAVWTRERGYQKGHHINVMANIPVRLLPRLNEYLARSFRITERGLKFSYGDFGMKTLPMQMGKLRYFCKSLDHTAFVYQGFETCNIAEILGIRHVGTDGVVRAKRSGTTENLGRKARRAASWKEARFPEEVAQLLNPEPFRRKAA
jgi:hypothetical protein